MQRLLRLAKKTGSPVIVTDQDGDEPAVLLPLETYEAMVDGLIMGEEEVDGEFIDEDWPYSSEETMKNTEYSVPDEVPLQEMDQDLPFPGEEAVSEAPEVTVEDVPFDPPIPEAPDQGSAKADDLGEEQFYLEPIE